MGNDTQNSARKSKTIVSSLIPKLFHPTGFGGRANVSLTSQILKLYHCYLTVILAFSNRQENITICILSSWQMKEKQDRSNVLNDQPNSYGSEVTLLSLGLSFI